MFRHGSKITASVRHVIVLLQERLSSTHHRLTAAICIYAALLIAFLTILRGSAITKYTVVILGVVLAGLIAELTSKAQLRSRIILLCVPAVGAALVQLASSLSLQNQFSDIQIRQNKQDSIREREKRLQEELVLDPIETVGAMINADAGFRTKAARLYLQIADKEARILKEQPDLGARILRFPEEASSRLKAYQSLRNEGIRSPTFRRFLPQIDEIIHLTEDWNGYLIAAQVFQRDVKPRYLKLQRTNKSAVSTTDVCNGLKDLVAELSGFVEQHHLAGVYDHLGNLAMTCDMPEEALASFYHGLSLDQSHIPIYEALAYALWILNKDSHSALTYAALGRSVTLKEATSIKSEFEESERLYSDIGQQRPEYADTIRNRADEINEFYEANQKMFQDVITKLTERLNLAYCYFSALELMNETDVRRIMAQLIESHPEDPDIEDSMGFVLMRFGDNTNERNEARQLFRRAIENKKSGPTVQRLASAHLQELTILTP